MVDPAEFALINLPDTADRESVGEPAEIPEPYTPGEFQPISA
ncbi:hypothetical protein [Streptomyces virginiae]